MQWFLSLSFFFALFLPFLSNRTLLKYVFIHREPQYTQVDMVFFQCECLISFCNFYYKCSQRGTQANLLVVSTVFTFEHLLELGHFLKLYLMMALKYLLRTWRSWGNQTGKLGSKVMTSSLVVGLRCLDVLEKVSMALL